MSGEVPEVGLQDGDATETTWHVLARASIDIARWHRSLAPSRTQGEQQVAQSIEHLLNWDNCSHTLQGATLRARVRGKRAEFGMKTYNDGRQSRTAEWGGSCERWEQRTRAKKMEVTPRLLKTFQWKEATRKPKPKGCRRVTLPFFSFTRPATKSAGVSPSRRSAAQFLQCPEHVRLELMEYMNKKKQDKINYDKLPDFDDVDDMQEVEDDVQLNAHGKRIENRIDRGKSKAVLVPNPKKGKLKGPMDSFAYKKPKTIVELRKQGRLRQTNVDEKLDKERRAVTIQYISRFLYQAGIPFNVTRLDSFKCMIEAIGQYGPNLKPPSYHEVRVTCLKKEVEYTNELLKSHKDMWEKYGCAIMADGWTSRTGKSIINFLVNCPAGSMFVKSIDASSYSKTGEKTFELLDEFVEAGKTRFATCYLTLKSIHKHKNSLRAMFISEEWVYSKWAKEAKGKRSAETVLMPSFWNNTVYILKAMGPLVRVLRLVDNERKPAKGYLYEAKDRAKDAITSAFNGREEKYKDIFKIMDDIWECQLHHPLHAAGHFLNPGFFYDDPNIEFDSEVTSGLYACIEKLARYDCKDTMDPIALEDIDDSNEWLLGTMGEGNDEVAENEGGFLSDDEGGGGLTWGLVARASGVGKLTRVTRKYTKSSHGKSSAHPESSQGSTRFDLGESEANSYETKEDVEAYKSDGGDTDDNFSDEDSEDEA
ncbi:hypothetical protein Cni_G27257 [Canna indica]|uniref:DUF659 domain-containing protein n=1 Tax=Canna indica TaxID=4628 RepID=A0AAQ3L560_9LILI|nr:hypothetical protein Cni_G27257 [Canna indica]